NEPYYGRTLSRSAPALYLLRRRKMTPSLRCEPAPGPDAAVLEALRRYRILDTDPEQAFEDLAALATRLCGTPMAGVSFLDEDREWFKARVGLAVRQTPRDVAFGAWTVGASEGLVLPDVLRDERFARNPLASGPIPVRFYAGVPLATAAGERLGTVCVMD